MDKLTLQRIIIPIFFAAGCVFLQRLIKPEKNEAKAALLTGFCVAALDYAFEIFAGKINLWRYHAKFIFLGLPPDMFFDIMFLCTMMCMGYVYFKRKGLGFMYAVILSLCLGTWGTFHNKMAVDMGFMTFAPWAGYGTPWFIAGNYVLLGFIVSLTLLIYKKVSGGEGAKNS